MTSGEHAQVPTAPDDILLFEDAAAAEDKWGEFRDDEMNGIDVDDSPF